MRRRQVNRWVTEARNMEGLKSAGHPRYALHRFPAVISYANWSNFRFPLSHPDGGGNARGATRALLLGCARHRFFVSCGRRERAGFEEGLGHA